MLDPQLKLFVQGITITGYKRGIEFIHRLAKHGVQCLIPRFLIQKFRRLLACIAVLNSKDVLDFKPKTIARCS